MADLTLADYLMKMGAFQGKPLDDQQEMTRQKLLGPNWFSGYDINDESTLNDVNKVRGLYSMYDAASKSRHPLEFLLRTPGATTGMINQLIQQSARKAMR